jgi:hypothetical protein
MKKLTQTISIQSFMVERDWLMAPKTFMTDSFEPFVEEIFLPMIESDAGKLILTLEPNSHAKIESNSFIKKLLLSREKAQTIDQEVILDLRAYSPGNLAHAITIHLPIALYVTDFLNSNGQKNPLLVFPKKLPNHVNVLFSELGFKTLLTDGTVYGNVCRYQLDTLTCLRSVLPELIKRSFSNSDLPQKLQTIHNELPRKIFISRRDSRCLSNEVQVESFLAQKGYKKLYLEDYTILEQLALVSLADNIVAIHGAALGPLIFRQLFDKPALKLVELYSPAHMSDIYRIVMHQIAGKWIGVRGRAWPKLIEQAYECSSDKVRQYSLNNFELCLDSLKLALAKIEL